MAFGQKISLNAIHCRVSFYWSFRRWIVGRTDDVETIGLSVNDQAIRQSFYYLLFLLSGRRELLKVTSGEALKIFEVWVCYLNLASHFTPPRPRPPTPPPPKKTYPCDPIPPLRSSFQPLLTHWILPPSLPSPLPPSTPMISLGPRNHPHPPPPLSSSPSWTPPRLSRCFSNICRHFSTMPL